MKKIIFILFLELVFISYCKADSNEMWFTNNTDIHIYVKVFPISMVINGADKCDLKAANPENGGTTMGFYINGTLNYKLIDVSPPPHIPPDPQWVKQDMIDLPPNSVEQGGLNADVAGYSSTNGNYCYGRYRIEFYKKNIYGDLIFIDYVNYENDWHNPPDMAFYIDETTEDNTNGYIVSYLFDMDSEPGNACKEQVSTPVPVSAVNREVNPWHPYPDCDWDRGKTLGPTSGSLEYSNSSTMSIFPLDSRSECD